MTKKKMPQTIEECNTEMERTQKQIRPLLVTVARSAGAFYGGKIFL